jgi:dihydroneopterin aldolase
VTDEGRRNAIDARTTVGPREDAILLERMRIPCALGVTAAERQQRRPVLLDLELGFDFSAACRSDELADTIDYGEVFAVVESVVGGREHLLVEALGERIAEALFGAFALEWVRIWVRKPKPIEGDVETCGIRMTRSRR